MRVAALADIHGNAAALEAVLAEVDREDVDLVLVGGDIAAGPLPGETLALLAAAGERVKMIRGNGDRELGDWPAARLAADDLDRLRRLPTTARIDVDALGPTLFCHGSPRSDDEIITAMTPEARLAPMLRGVEETVVVCAHTHVQFDRRVAGKRIVNPGSVGRPYEGAPGAYWALLGPGVELRRTEYDYEAAAHQIRASGYPEADELVADLFELPVSAAEATEFFERMGAGGEGEES